jgi:predicted nucleotidyltransferase
MPDHGLDAKQIDILRRTLATYADKIECAGLFGSRATGKARANSDIDLVLYGALDEGDVIQLHGLFEESLLALKVDIQAYNHITYPPLKKHIDDVMQVLFDRADLGKV